jgi:hypothetical protein
MGATVAAWLTRPSTRDMSCGVQSPLASAVRSVVM